MLHVDPRAVISLLLLPWAGGPSEAIELGNADLTATVSAATEYDDNVRLSSGADQEPESDMVFRLTPSLGIRLPVGEHSVSLGISGENRRGLETGISDLNFSAGAGVDLDFPVGLRIGASGDHTQTRFDQELQEEAGTPDSAATTFQTTVAYTYVERLRGEVSFGHRQQAFDQEAQTPTVDRDVASFAATVFVPLTREYLVSRLSYSLEEQDSPQRPERNYTDESYRIGAEWTGPVRFSFSFDIGQQAIELGEDQGSFDETVFELGTVVRFTDSTHGEVRIGRDGFGELTYRGDFSHRRDRGFEASFSFGQQTQPSFSFVFASTVLQTTQANLSLSDRFAEDFTVTLGAGYQLQESPFSKEQRDDQVWNGRLEVGYQVVESRLGLAARYQYSSRTSSVGSATFTNNRVGIVATLTF